MSVHNLPSFLTLTDSFLCPIRVGTSRSGSGQEPWNWGKPLVGRKRYETTMNGDLLIKRLHQSFKEQQSINCLLRNARKLDARRLRRF